MKEYLNKPNIIRRIFKKRFVWAENGATHLGLGVKSLRKQSRSFEDWMVWVGYGTGRFCVLMVGVSFVESRSGSGKISLKTGTRHSEVGKICL